MLIRLKQIRRSALWKCQSQDAVRVKQLLYIEYYTLQGREGTTKIKVDPSHLPGAWLRVFCGPRISTLLSFVPDTRLSSSSISLNTYSYFFIY